MRDHASTVAAAAAAAAKIGEALKPRQPWRTEIK